MRTLVERATACGILATSFAIAACSSTTAIRPDQLPILTQAAARRAQEAEVIGASGRRVRVKDTLEGVEITLGGGEAAKTFDAPLEAEVDGATLAVSDERRQATLPLASIQDVKVTYVDKDGMFAAGVVLDVFGGLFLAAGTAATFFAATARHGVGADIFLIFALPPFAAGAGLLIPGVLLTKRGGRLPQYPSRPLPRAEAGLGSLRVTF